MVCVVGEVRKYEKKVEVFEGSQEDISNRCFVGVFVAAGLIAVDLRWLGFAVVLVDGGALSSFRRALVRPELETLLAPAWGILARSSGLRGLGKKRERVRAAGG